MALDKVVNPNVLVNLISRRVRQLNSAGGAGSRPLVESADQLGAADVALREVVEEKITFELLPALTEEQEKGARKKRRH